MRRALKILILVILLIGIVGGVIFIRYFTKSGEREKTPTRGSQLNIFNWEDYLSESVIEEFERQYGIKVNLETFTESSFAFSQIQSNPDKYDLFVTDNGEFELYRDLKMLSPLDHEKIPNIKNIKSRFRENPYDPQNKYCVPYVAGYTGILINKKYVKEFDGTRKILFDPRYKNKIVMGNNTLDILFNALFFLKIDPLNAKEEDFEGAIKLALRQKELVLAYLDPISQRKAMMNEEAWIAYIYSTEAVPLLEENENLEFFAPAEGVYLWTDLWCIPKLASHKNEAHLFLNFLLDPQIAAKNSKEIGALMVVNDIEKFLDPDLERLFRGTDFPADEEIIKRSRYEQYSISRDSLQRMLNQLQSQLNIEK